MLCDFVCSYLVDIIMSSFSAFFNMIFDIVTDLGLREPYLIYKHGVSHLLLVISLSNIDLSINEMLLWHGTSKAASSAITKDGFRIPKGDA